MPKFFFEFIVFACVFGQPILGRGGCPENTAGKLTECIVSLEPIVSTAHLGLQPEQCGLARDGLACINDVVNSCENIEDSPINDVPGWSSLMQHDIESACDEQESPSRREAPMPNEVNTCSRRDQRKLQKCSRRMQRYSVESPIRCGKIRKSLDCMTFLLAKCSSIVGSETVDRLNSVRQNLMAVCMETNEPDDDSDENDDMVVSTAPSTSCPSRHTEMLTECVRPMQQINPAQGRAQRCSIMNAGLACVEDIMTRCASEADVQAMASMLNMDHTKALVRSQCSGGPLPTVDTGSVPIGNCPPDFALRIQDCATPMQSLSRPGASRDLARACSVAMDGLECLNKILTDCAGRPEVQAISGMMNMDQMQSLLNQQCAHIQGNDNSSSGGSVNSNCPPGYTQLISDCVAPLDRLDEIQDMELACSTMRTSLQCVEDLMQRCANTPGVEALDRMLNLDNVQTVVNSHCSGGPMPTFETGGGIDENCPSDYARRLDDCSEDMQSLSSPGAAQNLAQSCSTVQDGLGCMEQIFSDCSNKPDIQAVRGMINLDEMRDLVQSQCSSASIVTGGTSSKSCRYGDPTTQLQNCNRLLGAFNDEGRDLASRCRSVFQGFDCFDELIDSCPDSEAVSRFTSMVNLNQARQALQDVCP